MKDICIHIYAQVDSSFQTQTDSVCAYCQSYGFISSRVFTVLLLFHLLPAHFSNLNLYTFPYLFGICSIIFLSSARFSEPGPGAASWRSVDHRHARRVVRRCVEGRSQRRQWHARSGMHKYTPSLSRIHPCNPCCELFLKFFLLKCCIGLACFC
jgi:hypothetical protein